MEWSEINEAIQEKVNAATEGKAGEERDKALSTELKNLQHSVRQFLFDGGHKAATAQSSDKVKELERARTDLEAKVQGLDEKLEAAQKDAPDSESIKSQYEQEIKDLKAKHEVKIEELNGDIRDLKTGGFEGKLWGKIGPRLSEDGSDWARSKLLLMKQEGRIRPTDDGFEVLQPGKKIPYAADNEEELLSVVSSEIMEAAKPWALKGQGDSGGGSSGSNGSGGKTNKYAELQKAAKRTTKEIDDSPVATRRRERYAAN